jgi:putative endonuclease
MLRPYLATNRQFLGISKLSQKYNKWCDILCEAPSCLEFAMPLASRLIFQAVHWAARNGLRDSDAPSADTKKHAARRTGIRGETYAYWYLRRHGYVFVARNFTPRASKGEIDMVGYDGETLAFVEVRTRTVRDEMSALPELSVTPGKQHLLARTALHFLAERRVRECPCRFDVVAIDNSPGKPPVVRLHKDAFSPQM